MSERVYNIINSAIESRKLLKFNYDGGQRIVEPYCFGRNHIGTILLRSYQLRGFSKSGVSKGWKLFDVNKIEELEILDENFEENRSEYNPIDPAMDIIFNRI